MYFHVCEFNKNPTGTVQYAGSVNGHFQPPRTRVGVSLYDNG